MRIAFVSHEFPPDTGGGGIGTYLRQVTVLLAARGHEVEVFAGSGPAGESSGLSSDVRVHRVASTGSQAFSDAVVPPFSRRHQERPFDVVEGNDFDSSALGIRRAHPDLPYVVKLHTPRFVVDELHRTEPTAWQRFRMFAGAVRRGQSPVRAQRRADPHAESERLAVRLADEIAAPSQAIAKLALDWGGIDPEKVAVFPYPFVPPAALLALPLGGTGERVTFLGRLEPRKGVEDLARAIPLALQRRPDLRFQFVGREMTGPDGRGMVARLREILGEHGAAVEFPGACRPDELPMVLARTDIVALPSHWESFGLVCCEALAAGRAVVATAGSGFAEILKNGACGLLVPPRSPAALADAIVRLAGDDAERVRLGQAGRARVCTEYSAETVLPAQMASYERAIARRRTAAGDGERVA